MSCKIRNSKKYQHSMIDSRKELFNMLELELMTNENSMNFNADSCMPACLPTDTCPPKTCGPYLN